MYRALYILVKHFWEDSKLQNFLKTDLHFKVVVAVLGEITQNYWLINLMSFHNCIAELWIGSSFKKRASANSNLTLDFGLKEQSQRQKEGN